MVNDIYLGKVICFWSSNYLNHLPLNCQNYVLGYIANILESIDEISQIYGMEGEHMPWHKTVAVEFKSVELPALELTKTWFMFYFSLIQECIYKRQANTQSIISKKKI